MRPLIDFPAVRRAPAVVLEQLRQVDPAAELIHVEGDRWMLGIVKPGDPAAVRTGATQIRSARRWVRGASLNKIRLGRALLQGFKPIEEYQVSNDMQFGRIVEDFRGRTWRRINRWEDELERTEQESDVDHQRELGLKAQLADFEARANQSFRELFRGAVSFSQPGTSWGRRSLAN
jgi:hypothetical protein